MNFLVPLAVGLALAGSLESGSVAVTSSAPGAGQPAGPQPAVEANPADVETIDGVMTALFESQAGAAGEPRDWDRLRSLCRPYTRFLAARPGPDGGAGVFALSVEEYIDVNRTYFEKGGFFEKEVARRVETFGNMTHVWSTYESRRREDDPEPYLRGIYSVQLLRDADRWWLVNVFWEYERAHNPLPAKYLESPDQ